MTVRNRFWIFHGLFQPIIYLLLFGPLLNGVSATRGLPGGSAIQFFAPGLLIMNALFSAGFEGFSLQDKVDSGFLERLRVTPISRLSLALGFILQSSMHAPVPERRAHRVLAVLRPSKSILWAPWRSRSSSS